MRLTLDNALSPLLDAGYLEETIRRHFEPLFDPAFDDVLRRHYPDGVVFEIDGRPVTRVGTATGPRAPLAIRLGRRRTPAALGYLEHHDAPIPDELQGIAISTFGKVIKRGWDWLGLTPGVPARVSGLIEAPDLAACLTLSKSDFIRTGPRGATYLAFRKAIQEVATRQLAAWGDARDTEAKPRTQRLERDLARVLEDLADDFPLLRSIVDRRRGGQKRLPMPGRGNETAPGPLFASPLAGVSETEDAGAPIRETPSDPALEPGESAGADAPIESSPTPNAQPPEPPRDAAPVAASPVGTLESATGRRRPARYGLTVQFESRRDDPELGRLVDSTLWINDAHPAYARAAASRAMGYHAALAVALALAPLAVEAAGEHAFITQFLGTGVSLRRSRTRGSDADRQRNASRADDDAAQLRSRRADTGSRCRPGAAYNRRMTTALRSARHDAPALVQRAILGVLAHIPSTREPHGNRPATRARAIAKAAARKAATISGSLSLPPGPAGWLTIIPDLTMVWRIQSQMVADIAGAFGKESALAQEQMLYCLFRHAAAHSVRGLAVRTGERILIKRAPQLAIETAARKVGVPIARRIAGRGISRWLPVIGAAGVAGYAYYDTMRVAATTIELFQSGVDIETAAQAPRLTDE